MQLSVSAQHIEIDITDPTWCKCWLHDGKNSIYLGAECFNYIQTQLLRGLESKPDKVARHLNGKEVYWILSLSEEYHTLYCAIEGDNKILFVQDKYGNLVSETELPAEKANQWSIKLKEQKSK